MNLWWWRINATDSIINFAITRGNAKWRSFALRGWAYKQISALQPLLPSAKGLSFTFMYLLLCKESKFSLYSFFIFSFGKHHVVRKDLGTYVQLNIDSMSYYCWHYPWVEYVGRRNYKPLSFCVSCWNVLHHVFLLLFMMFLSIIMLFWSNSNAFSLIICKVYTKRKNSGSWKSGPGKATSGYLLCQLQTSWNFTEIFYGIFKEYWSK